MTPVGNCLRIPLAIRSSIFSGLLTVILPEIFPVIPLGMLPKFAQNHFQKIFKEVSLGFFSKLSSRNFSKDSCKKATNYSSWHFPSKISTQHFLRISPEKITTQNPSRIPPRIISGKFAKYLRKPLLEINSKSFQVYTNGSFSILQIFNSKISNNKSPRISQRNPWMIPA